ncbi:MAG: hypothetical protein AAGD43_14115, partial [Pseudomonadota bacterium]
TMRDSAKHVELIPGMPAEVFIKTGEHTPLRYLMDPLIQSFNLAFREESASHNREPLLRLQFVPREHKIN